MKKSVLLTFLAGAMLFFGCTKDTELSDSVKNLEKRVTSLEAAVAQINTEVAGIKNIISAIREGKDASFIYVKSVTPIPAEQGGGYNIVFSDGTTATIHDGVQGPVGPEGPTGPSPVMGATEVDGVFVWTANGQVVKDAEGKPVPVFGPLPQLRIKDGKWEVSYDEGKTWALVPTMGQSGSAITIIDKEDEVIFIIDGKEYSIKKEVPFFMTFDQRTDIGVPMGESALIEYTISGASETDNVEVDILNITSPGWEAKVMTIAKGETPGYIKVTNNDDSVAKIFVYATNGKGKTDIKSLQFEGGVLEVVSDVKPVEAEGGDIPVYVTTNMQYEVSKSPLASWITINPQTKATHTDTVTVTVAQNKLGQFRSGDVYVTDTNSGEIVEIITVLQYPKSTTTTDIYTLDRVADDTPVKMYSLAVVSSSKSSAVVTDGWDCMYVKGLALPVGKEVTISGIKASFGFTETAGVVGDSFEVTKETSDIEIPAYAYVGEASYYVPSRTLTTAYLSKVDDEYVFSNVMGDVFIVEDPVDALNIDTFVDKFVNVTGCVTTSEDIESEGEHDHYQSTFILDSISEMTPVQNANWTLSYASGQTYPDYPEEITNTVTGTAPMYYIYYFSEEELEEKGVTEQALPYYAIMSAADELQYYLSWGYSISSFAHTETYTEYYKEFAFGKYYAVAAGVDENGLPTGDYKVTPFEKKDPSVFAQYSDFLGKWQSSNGVFEIEEKVAGETYSIKNFFSCATNSGVNEIQARYDSEAGKMIIPEQCFAQYELPGYGEAKDFLVGRFGGTYLTYPVNMDYMEDLAIVSLFEDGTLVFKGAPITDELLIYYGYDTRNGFWVSYNDAADDSVINGYANYDFPKNCEKAQPSSEAYLKWIGKWDMGKSYVYDAASESQVDVDHFVMTISECIPNESYFIDGFSSIPAQVFFDEATGDILFKFNLVKTTSNWSMYTFGKTADRYAMMGDENDIVARFKITGEGTGAIEPVEYNGKVAVQIGCFAVTGSGWGQFTDCNYIYVPKSEITKVTSSPSAKSVGKTNFRLGELYPTTSDMMNNVNKFGIGDNTSMMKLQITKSNDGKTMKVSKKHLPVK